MMEHPRRTWRTTLFDFRDIPSLVNRAGWQKGQFKMAEKLVRTGGRHSYDSPTFAAPRHYVVAWIPRPSCFCDRDDFRRRDN